MAGYPDILIYNKIRALFPEYAGFRKVAGETLIGYTIYLPSPFPYSESFWPDIRQSLIFDNIIRSSYHLSISCPWQVLTRNRMGYAVYLDII